jgi:hypothetical protein
MFLIAVFETVVPSDHAGLLSIRLEDIVSLKHHRCHNTRVSRFLSSNITRRNLMSAPEWCHESRDEVKDGFVGAKVGSTGGSVISNAARFDSDRFDFIPFHPREREKETHAHSRREGPSFHIHDISDLGERCETSVAAPRPRVVIVACSGLA